MITFTLNGQTVQGEEGQNILQVAEKYGMDIPTLCHHPALDPARRAAGCAWWRSSTAGAPASSPPATTRSGRGWRCKTDTEIVRKAGAADRRSCSWPAAPNRPRSRRWRRATGSRNPRFQTGDGRLHPLRPVRAHVASASGPAPSTSGPRGLDMKVDTPFSISTEACIGCGACAFVCPTGSHHATTRSGKRSRCSRPSRSAPNTTWASKAANPSTSPTPRPCPTPR